MPLRAKPSAPIAALVLLLAFAEAAAQSPFAGRALGPRRPGRSPFGFALPPPPPKPVELPDYSVQTATRVATALGRVSPQGLALRDLARVLYVLEREAPSAAAGLRSTLAAKDPRHADIRRRVDKMHALYDIACESAPTRVGKAWPPEYACGDAVRAPSFEPSPLLRLSSPLELVAPPGGPGDEAALGPREGADAAARRRKILRGRDQAGLPSELLASPPVRFCVRGRCAEKYAQVATLLYGASAASASPPVFCAPRRVQGGWDPATADCSADWFDTLGGWKPWRPDGEPAAAPEAGVLPPFACFGSPHVLASHMVVPSLGAASQSGFSCRKRVFRVLATRAVKSDADANANLSAICTEMRGQVWGEKYVDINDEYARWCRAKFPGDPSRCPKPSAARKDGGGASAKAQPFMSLTREELLFFFGHQELFCRADRPGLTHFLYNAKWAETFTCGIARGLLEAGPFEEGVQACALSPYLGEEPPGGLGADAGALKARLHCWKHNRPTCEDISREPTLAALYKRSVFDEYDALREFRRTRNAKVFSLYDLKDAEKVLSQEDFASFTDVAKDEGTFGVKDFCRLVDPSRRALRCGYTKQTLGQWYELRQREKPQGCERGVCARGAYARGYQCGLFASRDLFCPKDAKSAAECKPFWVCGIDVGSAGRRLLAGAKAVCVGGARVRSSHSPRGDRSSLQCYERRFLWGESSESEAILRRFDWPAAVQAAAQANPGNAGGPPRTASGGGVKLTYVSAREAFYDARLHGFGVGLSGFVAGIGSALAAFQAATEADDLALVAFVRRWGHTLGHRGTLGRLLMAWGGRDAPPIPAVREFGRMAIQGWALKGSFKTQPFGCKGPRECTEIPFFPADAKDAPRDDERAKDITRLLHDVYYGGRPADGKWYQELVRIVTEGKTLRITTTELATLLRIHRLYRILDDARGVLLREAKAYADAVFATAARGAAGPVPKGALSRIELLDAASRDPIDAHLKGSVYCVSRAATLAGKGHSDDPYYVCASSPLLVSGAVERVTPEGEPSRRDEARAGVKMGVCFGGLEGELFFDRKAVAHGTAALGREDLREGNPFFLDLPKGPKQGAFPAWEMLELRSRTSAPRSERGPSRMLERLARRDGAETSEAERLDPNLLSQMRAFRRTITPARATAAPMSRAVSTPAAPTKSWLEGPLPDYGYFSKASWMRCAGFQYTDALWQKAEAPSPSAPSSGASSSSSGGARPTPVVTTDPRAEKANDIMTKVQEFGGPLISFVLQFLGHAPDLVKDLSHPSGSFIDGWSKKLTELGGKLWDEARAQIGKLQDQIGRAGTLVDKARDGMEKAREAMHKAEVDAAAAAGPAKEKADQKAQAAKEVFETARRQLQEHQGALAATTKDVNAGIAAACKKQEELGGSGASLSSILEELSKLIMGRIMKVLEPNVRHLISFGMRFLRGILGPIAAAVIGALGSVPFVGGALAPIGEVVYDLAMNLLEDAALRGLLGVVEKLLSQLLRAALTPVFSVAQDKILSAVFKEANAVLGKTCGGILGKLKFSALPPRDAWLGRALACGARPMPFDFIHKEAALARARMLRTASGMRAHVAGFARTIADRYLARYGLSYDGWMAAVARDAQPRLVARAASVSRALRREAETLRAKLRAR